MLFVGKLGELVAPEVTVGAAHVSVYDAGSLRLRVYEWSDGTDLFTESVFSAFAMNDSVIVYAIGRKLFRRSLL